MRRLLLDTHAIIWFINNSSRLPQHVRDMLEDESNAIYVSIVSPVGNFDQIPTRKVGFGQTPS